RAASRRQPTIGYRARREPSCGTCGASIVSWPSGSPWCCPPWMTATIVRLPCEWYQRDDRLLVGRVRPCRDSEALQCRRGGSRMTLDQLAQVAGIVGSVGIVLSMVFVGLQIRQQTAALNRNEHNSTMQQWTVIRMAIAKHPDVAELMTDGLQGKRALDAAEQL